MYYGERNPQAIEKAAKEGNLLVFEIEDLEIEDPSLITETARREAYKNDISSSIIGAVRGFQWAAHTVELDCGGAIGYLESAEQRIREAREKGYEVDFSAFQESIRQIVETIIKNFAGSRALLSYFEGSEFDFQEHKEELEERLPQLAQQYANYILKRARRTAKNLRRTYKTGKDLAGVLERGLAQVEELRPYGIEEDKRVSEVRSIAYQRGIEFLLGMAEELATRDKKRSRRILYRARRNALELGEDISDRVREIERLYST